MSSDQLDFGFDLGDPAPAPAPQRGRGKRVAPPPPAKEAPTPATWKPASLEPFHYTNALWTVVRDVVETLEELRYIRLEQVLLSIAQARQASKHGVYASCVPLRFEAG